MGSVEGRAADGSVAVRVAMGIGAGVGVVGLMPRAFGLTGVLWTDRIWESAEIAASCAAWESVQCGI